MTRVLFPLSIGLFGKTSDEKTWIRIILIFILKCLLGTKVAHAAVKSDIGQRCGVQKLNVVNFVNLDFQKDCLWYDPMGQGHRK